MTPLFCPGCEFPRTGQERSCLNCSRALPLLVLDSLVTDLASLAPDKQSVTMEGAIERLARALLDGKLDSEAYLARLDSLETQLLAAVEEMLAEVRQGQNSTRGAPEAMLVAFREFESAATATLAELTQHLQETVLVMDEIEQDRDDALIPEATGLAMRVMASVEQFEALCVGIKESLSS